MDTLKIVQEFIESNFQYKSDTNEISVDKPLLDSGLIDSAGILELVTFIESQFDVEVTDEDIIPDHFETINHIVSFVNGKQSSQ